MDLLKRLTDPVYCTTRMIVGLMFACHGGQKILPSRLADIPQQKLGAIGAAGLNWCAAS
jgi:hypothetical protein